MTLRSLCHLLMLSQCEAAREGNVYLQSVQQSEASCRAVPCVSLSLWVAQREGKGENDRVGNRKLRVTIPMCSTFHLFGRVQDLLDEESS